MVTAFDPETARPVIVTGPPLSGSSIIGQVLEDAGFFLGGNYSPPVRNNVSGVRSDRDLNRLHDRILEANNTRWQDPRPPAAVEVSPELIEASRLLLASKFSGKAQWGWVGPRATLLLDHWRALLPEARWIFVVRSPGATVWSMLDHGLLAAEIPTRRARTRALAKLWQVYAGRARSFVQQHPEISQLIHAPLDFSPGAHRRLADTLSRALDTRVGETSVSSIFDPFLLRVKAPGGVERSVRTGPVRRTWLGLKALHGPHLVAEATDGSGARNASREPQRRICLLSSRRFGVSESFIRAHLNGLPFQLVHLWGGFGGSKHTSDCLPLSRPWERLRYALVRELGGRSSPDHNGPVIRFLRRQKVEAVIAEYGMMAADIAPACEALGIPLIAHFHGFDAFKKSVLDEHREGYQRLFRTAAAIVAVSTGMVRQLEALGARPETLHLNPCGVDLTRFEGADPLRAPPLLLSVGRFVDKKGPQLTLLAFRKVIDLCPEARLVMVGQGDLLTACIHLVQAIGLTDSVTFTGAVPHAEIALRMRQARAFVQHSIQSPDGNSEGTPVAVMEAGAAGLPVVDTNHAGIPDVVVDGETGFLVDEGDTRAMADHMLSLVKDPALAARLGRRAREHVRECFSIERSNEGLAAIVHNVISSTAAHRPRG